MTAASYPYASGDLLEDRHTYFYSEYQGPPFLAAWRAQRDGVRKRLPEPADPPAGGSASWDSDRDVIETDTLLDHLYAAARAGPIANGPDRDLLLDLVKKFEVTKRIHRAYDQSFRAVDRADYRDPERYLRLAEVFEAAYVADGCLPCANALLKCMDTLTAMAECLDRHQSGRLARLIARERDHVEALASSLERRR